MSEHGRELELVIQPTGGSITKMVSTTTIAARELGTTAVSREHGRTYGGVERRAQWREERARWREERARWRALECVSNRGGA